VNPNQPHIVEVVYEGSGLQRVRRRDADEATRWAEECHARAAELGIVQVRAMPASIYQRLAHPNADVDLSWFGEAS
jgi:hypothetical protein